MHDHIARIQRYLLVIKEQYETIHATLQSTQQRNSSADMQAREEAYRTVLAQVTDRMHEHDELIANVQAYIDTFLADADVPATRESDSARTDAPSPLLDFDDEWMFQYEIDKAADGEYADDAFSYDDDSIDMSGHNDDDGEDDEEDTVPLTADQAYVQRLNQLRPLVLELGLVSGQPAEDFAVELSDQQFRQLFGLDGSTLKRPMNAVEALGVFGFVFSAEEKQRLLALDGDTQSAAAAEGEDASNMRTNSTDDASVDDWDDDNGPDYNVPGAA